MALTSVFKLGSSSRYIETDQPNALLIELRLKNSATSGDNRGMYLRFKQTGAGGGGEAARIYGEVVDVAGGTAHGAHISLGFGSSGRITGLGCGVRATLHVPATSTSFGGTVCGLQGEIYHDGVGSTLVGTTAHSVLRLVNAGNATGMATMLNWISLVGRNNDNNPTSAGFSATITGGVRVIIDGAVRYLLYSTTAPS